MEPEKFGRYVIKGELGRGGMATVFHAYDPRFERDVAIKVLPHAFLHDPQFRVRFDREAKTVALLEHPAIVPVYDFGEESEQPYIVMRYMSGGSLKERIEKGSLSTSEAAKIISRLAPALDVAHAKGIIHRDLKPGNILFDQYGNAFLSDFGIARLAQSSSVATLTQGAILGTPAYMSPEQIHGDKEIDGRSDIYALGVILYEMLTGSQPYRSDTPGKIMMMHVMEEVPHIRSIITDISPKVDEIIGKAMAKDPDVRYRTAAEMSAALDGTMELHVETAQVSQAPADFNTIVHQAPPVGTVVPSEATVISPPQPSPPPVDHDSTARPRTGLLAVGIIIFLLLVGGAGGGYLIFGRGSGEKNPTATIEAVSIASYPTDTIPPVISTNTPTQTTAPTETPTATIEATKAPSTTPTVEEIILPTNTSEPTATEPPKLPVVGGADQIAFLNENDIWIANVDGTNLVQITKDKTEKTNLNWTPDGQALTFISGKCVKIAAISTGEVDTLGCFDNSQYVESFEISPSGERIAVTVDRELYIIPNDLSSLEKLVSGRQMTTFTVCPEVMPWINKAYKTARWYLDDSTLAVTFIAPVSGRSYDMVRVIDVSDCYDSPPGLDEFPANRFTMSGYTDNPIIFDFSWNGILFALNSFKRNGGFGDLYVYNSELHKLQTTSQDADYINPIDGVCCYRDPVWSPDGRFLMFAFQDIRSGASGEIDIYYIPFGDIVVGAKFEPLAFPENLLVNAKEKPQMALRPAR